MVFISENKKIDNKVFNSDFIYISHLYRDHLDFKTLKYFKNKKNFYNQKFNTEKFQEKIRKFSNNIIEINFSRKQKLLRILQYRYTQILSNTSNVQDNINYDLDTSIIIQRIKIKLFFLTMLTIQLT